MATLIVRLTNETPTENGPTLIRSILGEDSVKEIEQLFPGDEQRDLASLFNVTLGSAASMASAIAKLSKHRQIEYAHAPQERKGS
jgi:hypothetical protein